MANTPGFFESLGNSLTGGGDSALTSLNKNGYSQYQVTGAPDVSKNFRGYDATGADVSATQPYQDSQAALMQALQARANGTGGPTVADEQLQKGIGSSLAASKAAVAGSRGQDAGLVASGLGTTLADTTAGGAGDAAALRVSEQENAQGALGGLDANAISSGNQLGEFGAESANQAKQFSSGLQAQLGGFENQDWQFKNNLEAQQQSQQNAVIAGQTNQAVAQNQSMMGNPVNQLGGLVSTAANVVGQASQLMADGAVVSGPFSGPGITMGNFSGLDEAPRMMADGGVTLPGPAMNSFAIPQLPSVSVTGPDVVNPKDWNLKPSSGSPSQPQGPAKTDSFQGSSLGGSQADPDTSGANLGATDIGGTSSAMEGALAAKGRVTSGPMKAIIGEAGPEAVVPIKPNGDADMQRAKDPALRQLLQTHPDLQHIQSQGPLPASKAQPISPDLAQALAHAGHGLEQRVMELESVMNRISSRSQRKERASASA